MEYEAVIGLEIHAQLRTNTKIFCGCRSVFGDAPNSRACPVCLGLPGALPVLNRRAVEMAVRLGLALDCRIAAKSVFARKNYFYPDLPKGYQISQYEMPLCENGRIDIRIDGREKRIGITRIHLEEDAGKLIHDQDVDSLFDVNRCGTPLVEIVSEPDIRSAAEAYAYLSALKQILGYLDICDCNMEEGSLRCDANISLRPAGHTAFGTKTELKNMNSFRGVEKALEYEIRRQQDVLSSGNTVDQETYLWDARSGRTVPMRTKESAHDYRYFPEPDLLPLIVESSQVQRLKAKLPELPQSRFERFARDFGLEREHAAVVTDSRSVADYFEQAVNSGADAKAAANWVMGEVLRLANETRQDVGELRITAERLAAVIRMVADGTISASAAKRVVDEVQASDIDPADAVEKLGLRQISDVKALEETVRAVLEQNPAECERFKRGEKKLMGFFVGRAMKRTKGKGNPKQINALVARLLG